MMIATGQAGEQEKRAGGGDGASKSESREFKCLFVRHIH